jgi:hypothetical protein
VIRRAPAEVRRRVRKPLAWAPVAGDWVVADARMLYLPHREALSWADVVRAAWDDPVLELQLPEGPDRLVIERPGNIPQVVNERVKASVVVQHHVPLRGDKGVRLVARRTPGTTDVTWRVTFDAGLDPQDPDLRAEADAALQDLRTTLGL